MKLRTYLVILVMIVVAWMLIFGGLGEVLYSGNAGLDSNVQYREYKAIKYGVSPYDSAVINLTKIG